MICVLYIVFDRCGCGCVYVRVPVLVVCFCSIVQGLVGWVVGGCDCLLGLICLWVVVLGCGWNLAGGLVLWLF